MSTPIPNMTGDRLEIRLKSIVVSGNGEIGRVDQVLVDPTSARARGLIVASQTPRRQITVPVSAIASADGLAVRLSQDGAALIEQAATSEPGTGDGGPVHFLTGPDAGQPAALATAVGMAEPTRLAGGIDRSRTGGAPLSATQSVLCRGGAVGHIDIVMLEPQTRCVAHLVVRCSDARRPDVRLPFWWAAEIAADRLLLDATWEQIDQCPGYRPDTEIADDVRATVWRLSALDPSHFRHVEVRTHAGIVELYGVPQTLWARETLERLTRQLKGVVEVRKQHGQLSAYPPIARTDSSSRAAGPVLPSARWSPPSAPLPVAPPATAAFGVRSESA